MSPGQVRLGLYLNGSRVGTGQEVTVEPPGEPEGRTLVVGQMHGDFTVTVLLDPPALAAVHARRGYGFAALRAMLDALPACSNAAHDRRTPATHEGDRCDACAKNGAAPRRELPSAPAVRHILEYVERWEKDDVLPEGER